MLSYRSRLCGFARALLVIEQPALADAVQLALTHGPFTTRVAYSIEAVRDVLDAWQPHLLIVDIDTAGSTIVEGRDAIAHGASLPVIALTHRQNLKTTLAAFECGVDDILTVPFAAEELVARILAVMRRTYRDAAVFTSALQVGELEIDILSRHVRANGRELHLTSLEQNLLYVLAVNAGRSLSRDEIMNQIWGTDYVAESNVVDRHVRNLRAKLQDDTRCPRYIATVPGHGYRFVQSVSHRMQRHDKTS
jgi:two-component system response regulator RegX3